VGLSGKAIVLKILCPWLFLQREGSIAKNLFWWFDWFCKQIIPTQRGGKYLNPVDIIFLALVLCQSWTEG
jgi:hypothetical protein